MTLTAAGNLSIGNTSVSALNERLNVTGNGIAIEATDAGSTMLLGHFGGADGIVGTFTNDALQFRVNNVARLTLAASTGAATFTSDLRVNTGGKIIFESGGTANSLFRDPANGNTVLSTAVDTVFVTSTGAERMRITSNGAVTINTPSSAVEALTVNGYGTSWAAAINGSTTSGQSYGLVVQGGTTGVDTSFLVRSQNGGVNYFRVRGDGLVITPQTYGNSVSTPRTVYIQSDGQIGGISSVRASKTNIQSFDTNWLYELNPVQFNYRKKDDSEEYTEEFDNELFYGLIAEETELVNKEICTYNDDKLIGIEYSKLVQVLVKAIQELTQKVNALENQ
jgi:hypothetical protein